MIPGGPTFCKLYSRTRITNLLNKDFAISAWRILYLKCKIKNAQDKDWKIVIPNDPEIKRTILEEIHSVPYSGHLGYQKTLKQIQKTFYWTDLVLDVRDFVLGCPVCQ